MSVKNVNCHKISSLVYLQEKNPEGVECGTIKLNENVSESVKFIFNPFGVPLEKRCPILFVSVAVGYFCH